MERKSNNTRQKRPNRRKVQGMAGPQTRREAASAANPIPAQKGFNALSVRGIPLFPIRFKAMLRYYEAVSISTSGTVGAYVFAANGLFDPNITGTGHQPMGFDQLMLSYEHYIVLRARINVVAQNTSTTGTPQIAVQLAPSNTAATLSQAIMEQGMLVKVHLFGSPGYGCSQQIRQSIDVAKFCGINSILSNPDFKGTVAANPVELAYFHIYGWDDNAVTSTVNLDVTIEYEAMFIEPKKLTQSITHPTHLARFVSSGCSEDPETSIESEWLHPDSSSAPTVPERRSVLSCVGSPFGPPARKIVVPDGKSRVTPQAKS